MPRRLRFSGVYTAVLAIALSIPVAAQAADAARATARVDVSKVRIDNFGQVSPTYFRGAQPQGQDYQDLAALGVKTVIDLTSDDAEPNEQAMVERAGMKYVHIPMTTHKSPSEAKIAQFLGLVDNGAPVYVHCVGGRHRTGVMTAIYRMTDEGWTADKAFSEMKRYKFGADFLHSEFKQFVYAYHPEPNANAKAAVVATKAGS